MATRRSAVPTISDLFEQAQQELEESIHKTNLYGYQPYPEQERFHRSQAFGRYISGGNRGGKTDAAVVDAIWTATGTHPYRPWPERWGRGPLQLRFIVVDIDQGVNEIILPKLRRWVPKSYLVDGLFEKSWDSGSLTFTFSNGSTIDFLTHNMDLKKHGGVPRHAIYFDEIPPQGIFNENAMRLMDYEGFWVICATSTEGLGWTYDYFWEPVEDGRISRDEVDIFTLSEAQNPYLAGSEESRNRYFVAMDKEEQAIRREGAMTARSGLVFPNFRVDTHVVEPFVPPKDWAWYSSVDFGFNNPTAWLWHAVSPRGDIVTFEEHYAREMVTPHHATQVHMKEAVWRRVPDIRVGDPAGKQRQMNSGTSVIQEYALNGVYISTDMIPRDPEIGIDKMQQYFEVRPAGSGWGPNRPKWVITSNCVNFIRELRKLRWATYESANKAYEMNKMETVHKKDDHAFDSAKYFATLMPDLTPVAVEVERKPVEHLTYVEMMARLRGDDSVAFVEDQEEEREMALTVWDVQPGWD